MLQLVAPIGEFVPAGAPLFGCTASQLSSTRMRYSLASRSASSAPSTRTSPTGCACSWTSPSGRWPTRRFSTRPPPSRQSTGCTTACASSPAGFPRRVASRRRRRTTTGRAVDGLGRIRAPRIRRDPARRRWLAPSVTPTAGRARRPPHGRTAGSPTGPRTPDGPAVIVDDRLDEGPEGCQDGSQRRPPRTRRGRRIHSNRTHRISGDAAKS